MARRAVAHRRKAGESRCEGQAGVNAHQGVDTQPGAGCVGLWGKGVLFRLKEFRVGRALGSRVYDSHVAMVARTPWRADLVPTKSADSKHTNSYGIRKHTGGVANKLLWTEEP
eukprot:306428-Chlamydomonas_euryale.AAC.1